MYPVPPSIWKTKVPRPVAASLGFEWSGSAAYLRTSPPPVILTRMEKRRGRKSILKKVPSAMNRIDSVPSILLETFWPKNRDPKLRSVPATGFGFFCACKASSWPWWKSDQSLHHPNSSLQAANPESNWQAIQKKCFSLGVDARYRQIHVSEIISHLFPWLKRSECQQKIKTEYYFGLLQDTHPESNVVAATTWGRDVPATNNEVASWIATGAMVEHLGRTTWHMSSTGGNIFCYPSSHHLAKIRKIK